MGEHTRSLQIKGCGESKKCETLYCIIIIIKQRKKTVCISDGESSKPMKQGVYTFHTIEYHHCMNPFKVVSKSNSYISIRQLLFKQSVD